MSESNALDIKFKAFRDGDIASPKLQGWVIEAVEKGQGGGLTGQSLCSHVSHFMTNNHGKYWHCFTGNYAEFYHEDPDTDHAARFDLDGEEWIVFKSDWLVELILDN